MNSKPRAAGLAVLLLATPATMVIQGCVDLNEHPTSALAPSEFYQNQDQILSGLAGVYASLRSTLNNYYDITEISTDEMVVPTRGSDWYDNGKWLELHRQTWGPSSAAGLDLINGTWTDLYGGVARANATLEGVQSANVPGKAAIVAELRTLRAFYYYLLMDTFGGVPIVTTTKFTPGPQATRADLFKFIEGELTAARADLPASYDAGSWGRLTKGSADAILASMYLNAQVFTGTVSAAGLQAGPARWQDAITVSDRILNSGVYSLAPAGQWRHNFEYNNQDSRENILVVRNSTQNGLGLNFLQRALHYSQLTPSPWNGFATLAQTYYSFDAADQRRQIFLAGPQVNQDPASANYGKPVSDRAGNPLVFTPEIGDITNAAEGEGVRIAKWPGDPNHKTADMGNDYAFFRLGEIYLIKAEAQNELGQTAQAVALLNTIRARVGEPALGAGDFTQATLRTAILNERLHELTAESKRRQDMIRYGVANPATTPGTYTAPFQFKGQTEPYRILFPIPQTQLATNPHLVQNPGY